MDFLNESYTHHESTTGSKYNQGKKVYFNWYSLPYACNCTYKIKSNSQYYFIFLILHILKGI